MTRIDFYYDVPDKLAIAVKLAHKAYAQRLPLLLYASTSERAMQVDRLLWTQPALGFLPHCRATSPLAKETPALIAETPEAVGSAPHDELLINLDDDVPPGFARFQRVIEIVGRDEADKAPGRHRYKFYKDRGYAIQRYDLSNK
ncbi:DNA polymerase III subunit chi [Azospira inquinata]|uniref:DNA polymerase III subunit chi n=1 Tax=Azospira inquinata TaxID=2785627 RepID=A0A975XVA2_9RHOO|nr:DNA polymerase III subunit chi [Azospira inquinata]QWT45029.1 DNA polymerase III subunit chi [Azospira inquinata]QWT49638.1 DNA polymerase III subunit chi [Azospira inquinata]